MVTSEIIHGKIRDKKDKSFSLSERHCTLESLQTILALPFAVGWSGNACGRRRVWACSVAKSGLTRIITRDSHCHVRSDMANLVNYANRQSRDYVWLVKGHLIRYGRTEVMIVRLWWNVCRADWCWWTCKNEKRYRFRLLFHLVRSGSLQLYWNCFGEITWENSAKILKHFFPWVSYGKKKLPFHDQ